MRSILNPNSSLNGVVKAPLWRRLVAWVIDTVTVVAIEVLILVIAFLGYSVGRYFRTGVFTQDYEGIQLTDPNEWVVFACMVVPFIIYHIVSLWLWKGHTPGKHLLQIRALSKNGDNPSLLQAIARTVLMPVSVVPLLLGYALFSRSRKNSSLHDWVAGTLVLREEVEHEILQDPNAMTSL